MIAAIAGKYFRQSIVEKVGRLQERQRNPACRLALAVSGKPRSQDGAVVRPDRADVIADGVVRGLSLCHCPHAPA